MNVKLKDIHSERGCRNKSLKWNDKWTFEYTSFMTDTAIFGGSQLWTLRSFPWKLLCTKKISGTPKWKDTIALATGELQTLYTRYIKKKNISRISSINTIKTLIYFNKAGTSLTDQDLSITHRRKLMGWSIGSICSADPPQQYDSLGPGVDRTNAGRG